MCVVFSFTATAQNFDNVYVDYLDNWYSLQLPRAAAADHAGPDDHAISQQEPGTNPCCLFMPIDAIHAIDAIVLCAVS